MLLKLGNIEKSFTSGDNEQHVLQGVSLDLDTGHTLALTGESGSGKSTLLHIAAGLELPDAGKVFIEGRDISQLDDAGRAALRRNDIGVIFQQFNLIPSLSVSANISFQARLSGKEDKAYIEHLMAQLGLTEHCHKYPEALSGGQQQRVAIARTLAAKPKLVLADEPTGNLDEKTAMIVLDQLLALVKDAEAALMVVTHSRSIAALMDRSIHLTGGKITHDNQQSAV